MMPYLSAWRDIALGAVKGLQIDEPALLSSSTDICVREDREQPIVVREFLKLAQAEFRPLHTGPKRPDH
jgi:hypothetical protein